MASNPWSDVLHAAAILAGDRDAELHIERAKLTREQIATGVGRESGMKQVLDQRLSRFLDRKNESCLSECIQDDDHRPQVKTLEQVQHETGALALVCVLQVHKLVAEAPSSQSSSQKSALLGSRDLALLKKLLAMSFAWRVIPVIEDYDAAYGSMYPNSSHEIPASQRFTDAEDETRAWHEAMTGIISLLDIFIELFRPSSNVLSSTALPVTKVAQTDVALLTIRIYAADVFRVLIRVAFGPIAETYTHASTNAVFCLNTLLEAMPTSVNMGTLRSVSSPSALATSLVNTSSAVPTFVREQCARLLSVQLLRPDGVRALLVGVLGANEADMLSGDLEDDMDGETTFKRLDATTKLLTTPPKGMGRSDYYEKLLPSVLGVLDPKQPPSVTPVHGMHRRAAAFALMRMLESDGNAIRGVLSSMIFDKLQTKATDPNEVDQALRLLAAAVSLAPPSPDFIQFMVSPVLESLLTLDTFLQQAPKSKIYVKKDDRTVDTQKNEVSEILHTWLRLGSIDEVRTRLSGALDSVFERAKGRWTLTAEGSAFVMQHFENLPAALHSDFEHCTSLSEPMISEQDETQMQGATELIRSLELPIDPKRLAALLKKADCPGLAGTLLMDALEGYARKQKQLEARLMTVDVGAAELERRSVFQLQLLQQLLEQFGEKVLEGSADRIFQFIDYALTPSTNLTGGSDGDAMSSLTNVQTRELDHEVEHEWELIETALNLLLSLLEGSPDITPQNTSILTVIRDKIESLRDANKPEVRSLAQELVLVMAARTKQATAPASAPSEALSAYREALRYLQDPIVPVRAHGLKLLADLVSQEPADTKQGPKLDQALLPAIFDIFIDAIQDEESFLYLNAVKGLGAMTARWRDSTLRPLVALYVGGDKGASGMVHTLKYGSELSQREVDKRLRIGEALLQVLQYCGETIVPSIDLIVHPLMTAARNAVFSSTLRSSFISILGTCVEIAPLALASNGTSEEMTQMCLELVQIESMRRSHQKTTPIMAYVSGKNDDGTMQKTDLLYEEQQEQLRDKDARAGIDTDAKLPQLRRSGWLLLAVLIRTSRHQLEDYLEECEREQQASGIGSISSLRMPGGGSLPSISSHESTVRQPTPLVSSTSAQKIIPIATYAGSEDADALVQQQARDCIQEAQLLQASYLRIHAT
ncbi:hypothetical protein MPSI1_001651 [Malassezia psittaci]|uniref:RNA polymerase II assembly factor Rtp1 C-terminal domain-containing protein n=1 Tax=Malassezia psittaci TaxID=1821823 RepID=A0AAF0F605_9BASI|nr:hypothetical protein MPSI1_001651 [Malassezia psittaci]